MPRYSLASADVDADGLTDLFVGAPFYHKVSWLPSYVYKFGTISNEIITFTHFFFHQEHPEISSKLEFI